MDLEPAGEFARRARRESRSAGDLLKVFGAKTQAIEPMRVLRQTTSKSGGA